MTSETPPITATPPTGAILVVDDQKAMRMLVRSSLRQLGYDNVVECEDGKHALKILGNYRACLVISDLNMPNLDGLGLLRAVRASTEHKNTPFILLTARGDVDVVKQAVAVGVSGYLVKPFAMGQFKQKVEAAIGPRV
jgi:two-component system chemotaxis response regulator CheY